MIQIGTSLLPLCLLTCAATGGTPRSRESIFGKLHKLVVQVLHISLHISGEKRRTPRSSGQHREILKMIDGNASVTVGNAAE